MCRGQSVFDLVTVGHFVVDLIVSPKIANPTVTLGGSPTFVSLAATNLGAKVGVVSKVGGDFLKHLAWLRKNNVDLSHVQIVENASTTSFVIRYLGGRRKLVLKSRAPEILLEDILPSLSTKAVHVAPVANELSAEVVHALRERTAILSVDPQGFVREFDAAGNVKPKPLDDTTFLQHCDIFKSSIQEIKMVARDAKLRASMEKVRELGVKIVLATMGGKGVVAHFGGEFYHIPACKPKVLRDPTGAGDTFIGAFLAEYIRGKEPLWCCCVGSAAASFVVEEVGSQRFGEKDEVYERATEIYEKGIKPLPREAVD